MFNNNNRFPILTITMLILATMIFMNTNYFISSADAQSNTTNIPKFLFIQQASSSSINTSDNELSLNNISDNTIAFSDRPERLVKQFDTQSFVDSWNKNVSDSFALDPPNAVIISDEDQENQGIIVLELMDPKYDAVNKILKYSVKSLNIENEQNGEDDILFSEIGSNNNSASSNMNIPDSLGIYFID